MWVSTGFKWHDRDARTRKCRNSRAYFYGVAAGLWDAVGGSRGLLGSPEAFLPTYSPGWIPNAACDLTTGPNGNPTGTPGYPTDASGYPTGGLSGYPTRAVHPGHGSRNRSCPPECRPWSGWPARGRCRSRFGPDAYNFPYLVKKMLDGPSSGRSRRKGGVGRGMRPSAGPLPPQEGKSRHRTNPLGQGPNSRRPRSNPASATVRPPTAPIRTCQIRAQNHAGHARIESPYLPSTQ
jgi:hypothetical protein